MKENRSVPPDDEDMRDCSGNQGGDDDRAIPHDALAPALPQEDDADVCRGWDDLFSRGGHEFGRAIRPLHRFCIEEEIRVAGVDSAVAAKFAEHWLNIHDLKSGRQTVRRIFDFWNANAKRLGVCAVDPPLPRADRDDYRADLADASPAMSRQIEDLRTGWMTQRRRGRVLEAGSADRRLRTFMLFVGAFCEATNRTCGSFNRLEELVAPEPAGAAYRYVLDRAKKTNPKLTKTPHVYEMARVVANIADEIYPDDDPRRIELHRMKRAMAPPAKKRLSPRKQKAVSPFIDPEFAREARDLPRCYYHRHVDHAARDRLLATRLTAACGAELLMATSMWPCELARLRLCDVTETSTPEGRIYTIDTKRGDQPKSYALGPRSSEVLHAYLTRVRLYRPGVDSNALFPGKNGATQKPAGFSRAISAFLNHHLDHQIPASDLPDAIAVMLGTMSAENEGLVRQFMGRLTDRPDPLITSIRTWRSSREADGDSNDADDDNVE